MTHEMISMLSDLWQRYFVCLQRPARCGIFSIVSPRRRSPQAFRSNARIQKALALLQDLKNEYIMNARTRKSVHCGK